MSTESDSASRKSNNLGWLALSFGVPRAFGESILAHTKKRGWSLRDLAGRYDREAEVDGTVSYLSRFINGKVRPKPKHIEQLADALRLDGHDREHFIMLGLLSRGPEEVEVAFLKLQAQLERLERLLRERK